MHRTVLLSAALASTLLVQAGGDTAQAAPGCQGTRATVVGHAGQVVTGTAHRDVIVTNGATRVRALGGADLICVDRGARGETVVVNAGPGDDVGVVRDRDAFVSYRTGTGTDTYRSVGRVDHVRIADDGRDRVSTGPGGDSVRVVRGGSRRGSPSVDLGPGDDELFLAVGASHGRFVGGGRSDRLTVSHRSQQVWVVDNKRGHARAGRDVRFRWQAFEAFDLGRLDVRLLRFRGGAIAEELVVSDGKTTLAATMGGGDDLVIGSRSNDHIDGQAGHDTVDGFLGMDLCRAEIAYNCEG